MRKTLCASVLLLALCGSAFAGDMSTPSAPQPPPPPQNMTVEKTTADDVIQTGEADGFTETLLSVLETALESVLALS
jgi:hypothetical protein